MQQDIEEFELFHRLLTYGCEDYQPWYFTLTADDKNPMPSKGGWKHPRSQLSIEQAVKWMEHGHNIGLAGTDKDHLVIVDVDDENVILPADIKPTLSARSRSRTGTHHFYYTHEEVHEDLVEEGPTAKANIPTENAGEVRSVWQYVVVPGSYVPCSTDKKEKMSELQRPLAGKYTIERTLIPSVITFEQLPEVFQTKVRATIKAMETQAELAELPVQNMVGSNSALFTLEITDVIHNAPANERFPSLFHGSDSGKNSSVVNGLYHCWRHNVSHNAITALAVMADVDTCVNAGFPHQHSSAGPSSIDVSDGQKVFAIWKFAKDRGIIAPDDPIPATALKWFALANKMCTQDDLIDGWKLPPETYGTAKDLLRTAGIVGATTG